MWLRVALALVLVATHGATWLGGVDGPVLDPVAVVPVFLFLSGFYLVTSYAARPDPWAFLRRRYLRVFPILFLGALLALLAMAAIHGAAVLAENGGAVAGYVLAQVTLFQVHWPAAFAELGVPRLTGALWFVGVILLYALMIPLLHRMGDRAIWILGGISLCLYLAHYTLDRTAPLIAYLSDAGFERGSPARAIASVLLRAAALFWLFAMGYLARRSWAVLGPRRIRVMIIVGGFALTLLIDRVAPYGLYDGRAAPPWFLIAWVAIWVSLAVDLPNLPRIADISGAVFLSHIQVLWLLDRSGVEQVWLAVPICLLVGIAVHLSLERPMLRALGAGPRLGTGPGRAPSGAAT